MGHRPIKPPPAWMGKPLKCEYCGSPAFSRNGITCAQCGAPILQYFPVGGSNVSKKLLIVPPGERWVSST